MRAIATRDTTNVEKVDFLEQLLLMVLELSDHGRKQEG